jgi:Flp pilus assembly protein TadG
MRTRSFLNDEMGASAAEFALVLPLLLIFLFGVIDGGRFLWEDNRAEKATQAGARFAVVSDPIAGGLTAANYVGVGGLTQGDIIPASAFGKITCTSTACTCTTNPCPALGTRDGAAFTRVVTRMRGMMSNIRPTNVTISYEGSGLGYAGDPNGMDLSPLVTVELTGLTFRPITSLFLLQFSMPSFRTSLTSEDASGTQSN